MELSEIQPTPAQIAELDQKTCDLALLARLLGGYRNALVRGGFCEDQAFALVARFYETVLVRDWAGGRRATRDTDADD